MFAIVIETLGWYGAGALLIAYGMAARDPEWVTSLFYRLLNFTGALGMLAATVTHHAWGPATLNFVWALIAARHLIQKRSK